MPIVNDSRTKLVGRKRGMHVTELPAYDTLDNTKTTVTTSATLLIFPDEADKFMLVHRDVDSFLYLGNDNTITVDGAGTCPIRAHEMIPLDGIIKGDGNDIYGISDSANITVYILGFNKG